MVDEDGKQLGVLTLDEALEIAYRKKLDLVEVAPNARPKVCRIMDFGKYKFELTKKEKEAKKKQKVINIKEIRLSPTIEEHDLKVKANNALRFLKSGDKVKVTIRFRGREMAHMEIGKKVMQDFTNLLADTCQIEKRPKTEGRNMIMVLAPKQL